MLSTRCRGRAVRRSPIPISDADIFRQVLTNFIMSTTLRPASTMATQTTHPLGEQVAKETGRATPGLKKIAPYWYPYTTMAKGRWLGREILEVVSTEFRDRSMEFYVRVSTFKSKGWRPFSMPPVRSVRQYDSCQEARRYTSCSFAAVDLT